MPKLSQIAYILGMPRAGTTFLYHNLQKHPQIYVPFRRKSNYFSLHRDKPQEWFLNHFKEIHENQIGIDTETLYFADKHLKSFEQIHQFNPDAKVMLFVRKPGEWAWSFYKQIATFDKNIIPFENFLQGDYVLIEDGKEVPYNITDGDIKYLITSVMETFKGNALIVNFELFERDPLTLLQEIENFLGIAPHFSSSNFENKKINASNRGHIHFLAALLRQQWLINLLNLLPRSFVIFIRRSYDNLSAFMSKKQPKDTLSPEVLFAAKAYAEDELYVKDLFAKNDIVHA